MIYCYITLYICGINTLFQQLHFQDSLIFFMNYTRTIGDLWKTHKYRYLMNYIFSFFLFNFYSLSAIREIHIFIFVYSPVVTIVFFI
jgi:hypothetical protein